MQLRFRTIAFALTAVLAVAACKRNESAADATSAAAPMEPPAQALMYRAPKGTALAYEHTIEVRLPEKDIAARVGAIQSACFSQSVGDCAVLEVAQQGGDHPSATVKVRVAPEGVGKLIGAASQGGEITERSTSAEDLANAMRDTAMVRARLEKEHARLLQFQDRPNVKLEELMELSKRLAEIESALDVTAQEQATQRRRIDTNLLTLRFLPPGVEVGGSEIGNALRDSGTIFASVIAGMIRLGAGLLPIAVVALVFALGVRRVLRWRKRLQADPA